jgi:hypothetical protein
MHPVPVRAQSLLTSTSLTGTHCLAELLEVLLSLTLFRTRFSVALSGFQPEQVKVPVMVVQA